MNYKEIGIVTLHNSNNYGAVYQVYALSRYLESLGHKVFVLNYQADKSNISTYFKNPISAIRKIVHRKALSLQFIKNRSQYYKANKRENQFLTVFSEFRNTFLNITDNVYSYEMLKNNCPAADVFITGSDQVWAADFLFSSPAYLLGFVPKTAKKVSYAASFGKSKLEPYLHRVFKSNINDFDSISVREKDGISIVKDIAGIDAVQVLDPTLLIDNYSEIIDYSLVPSSPYIFIYRLNQEYELACWMMECIENITDINQIPVFSVSTNCCMDLNKKIKDLHPTPGQLLGLIERSSLTLTNSFHGTVFALLFGKSFLTFPRDRFNDKQNLRMTELLSSVGLEALFCEPFSDSNLVANKIKHRYNHEEVRKKMDNLIENSKNYLIDSLV